MAKRKTLKESKSKCAIITGDLHLLRKPGMWSGRTDISGDDVYALNQVVQLAKEHEADLYMLGDVFDSVSNLPRPLVSMQKALTGYPFDTQKVRYIQGQHELVVQAHYENYPWLSMIPGTEHMAYKVFDFLGSPAYALDYFTQQDEDELFSSIPEGTEVLFLHGTADVAMSINSHFSVEKLPKSIKLVLAGDWHMGGEYKLKNSAVLMYTGTTWFTNASEPTSKYVYKVTKEGSKLNVEKIVLASRPVYKVSELDGSTDLPEWPHTDLPEDIQTPVIIIDEPISPEDYEVLMTKGHTHMTSAANPDVPTPDAIERENELSNREILERYCDVDADEDEFMFTLDVIEHSAEDAVQRLKVRLGMDEPDSDAAVTIAVGDTNDGTVNLDAGAGTDEYPPNDDIPF